MFDVVHSAESDLVISLTCTVQHGELPSFGFAVPVSFEWLTIRDAAQSCYDWIEEAVSEALFFTVRVGGFARRIAAKVRNFHTSLCRSFRPRMILCRLKQFRL